MKTLTMEQLKALFVDEEVMSNDTNTIGGNKIMKNVLMTTTQEEKRMAERVVYEIHVGYENVRKCQCHGTPTYSFSGISQLLEITEEDEFWVISVADENGYQEMNGQYEFSKGGVQEVEGFVQFMSDWGDAFPQFK